MKIKKHMIIRALILDDFKIALRYEPNPYRICVNNLN